MTQIRRKLYKRGSSFETTIPMPLLFALDTSRRHYAVFTYEKNSHRWYLDFEEMPEEQVRKGKKR